MSLKRGKIDDNDQKGRKQRKQAATISGAAPSIHALNIYTQEKYVGITNCSDFYIHCAIASH